MSRKKLAISTRLDDGTSPGSHQYSGPLSVQGVTVGSLKLSLKDLEGCVISQASEMLYLKAVFKYTQKPCEIGFYLPWHSYKK